jgi:phytoene dehydrogenase-like protein
LGRGVDTLVASVRQAEAGLLPDHPSIAWHEPTAVDPTRAPEGRAIVRLQMLDAPHTPTGDAAGTGYGTNGWDDQAFTQRPIPAHGGGHRTAVPGVWLTGAATWPGASVSGASGRAVARALIDSSPRSSATTKVDG